MSGNTTRMVIDNLGNVGIGTTVPREKLHIDSGEVIVSGLGVGGNGGQFRMVYGNYGAFWRNDGADLNLLLTNSGSQYGSYNGLRPFSVNLPTGNVYMEHNLQVFGGIQAGGNASIKVFVVSGTSPATIGAVQAYAIPSGVNLDNLVTFTGVIKSNTIYYPNGQSEDVNYRWRLWIINGLLAVQVSSEYLTNQPFKVTLITIQ